MREFVTVPRERGSVLGSLSGFIRHSGNRRLSAVHCGIPRVVTRTPATEITNQLGGSDINETAEKGIRRCPSNISLESC